MHINHKIYATLIASRERDDAIMRMVETLISTLASEPRVSRPFDSRGRTRKEAKLATLEINDKVYLERIEEVQEFIDKKNNGDETPWSKCPCFYSIKYHTKKEVSFESCQEYISIMSSKIIANQQEIINSTVFESRNPIRFVVKSHDTKRRKLNVFETED
ncbi:hypothetical protein GUITHDRAFT_121715 [Guillardia theta CCMP2712]|uniref:Uncharacterized protein n=1 Tax=Guillardia theta (strain CCMP2712) TaxID=905079 RepID=L1I790_GUITC|nr:hypothetical protein GUITHDRAFT_121715 [Guillardia theta CCMP2712]EKX32123.1 hypothetical protein GUITHDRAFT_121715 [Guillardia theta CCMP2712]|eukprot:XP_005819103.1 hypothetical protein GUITHDRAFT_121715 [Guillardia theta CCMP2712]